MKLEVDTLYILVKSYCIVYFIYDMLTTFLYSVDYCNFFFIG